MGFISFEKYCVHWLPVQWMMLNEFIVAVSPGYRSWSTDNLIQAYAAEVLWGLIVCVEEPKHCTATRCPEQIYHTERKIIFEAVQRKML